MLEREGIEKGNRRLEEFGKRVKELLEGSKVHVFNGREVVVMRMGEGICYEYGPLGLLGYMEGFGWPFRIDGGELLGYRLLYDRGDGVWRGCDNLSEKGGDRGIIGFIGEWFGMIEEDVLGLFGVDVWGAGEGVVVSAPHMEWNSHRLDIRLSEIYGWEEFVMNIGSYVEWRRSGERLGVVDNIFGGIGRVMLN